MENRETGTIHRLMLRLLPAQVITAFVDSLNTAITVSFSATFVDVYSMDDISYQNIMGLNVLTIRV
jgi:hypothetical protein